MTRDYCNNNRAELLWSKDDNSGFNDIIASSFNTIRIQYEIQNNKGTLGNLEFPKKLKFIEINYVYKI